MGLTIHYQLQGQPVNPGTNNMGANFLLYSLPWAQLNEGRQRVLHDTIDHLAEDQLQDVAEALCAFDGEDLSKVRTAMHASVREYMELDGRCDTTTWRYPSDTVTRVYTGGLSWGDSPTDCCETFDILVLCAPVYELLDRWAREDADGSAAAESHTNPSVLRQVLAEFCRDVEAVGRDQVAEEWPDLMVTYDRAMAALQEGELQWNATETVVPS